MFDLKKRAYVILKCATMDEAYKGKEGNLRFCADNVVEVAAVKIQGGEIKEHFSTFVAIDGYSPRNLSFNDEDYDSLGITSAHLIGAPDFKTVASRVFEFARDCTLLTCGGIWKKKEDVFKEKAASCGIIFNNPTFSLNDIYTAINLQNAIEKQGVSFEKATTLQLAAMLAHSGKTWKDIFEEYDIFTFSKEWGPTRQDSLTWALAYAELFIKMVNREKWGIEETNEDYPF